jgi:serine/threonine protein kinase
MLQLKLCSAADFRRSRRHVRRLARDLPAFDSVWLDALLHARKVTPFQARLLESPDPEKLCIGPCVLVDRLGRGTTTETYLARKRDGGDRCVLKLIDRPAESVQASLDRLGQLVLQLKQIAHPGIVGPHSCLEHHQRLVAVSRFVPGLHAGELLVRRGRFPAAIVAEIARQLFDGLATLEERHCVHGDIRLANVRLTSEGVAVLVDCGIKPAVAPELSIHNGLTPEECNAIAPELIGTGNRPTVVSDIYALGCLLWQLLAGRPPYSSGDPLAKLACHQTRTIEDVREWAPDTPEPLAAAIRAFTNKDSAARPQNFADIRAAGGPSRRLGRKQLARFRTLFESGVPRVPIAVSDRTSTHWPLVLTLLFVLSGAALTLLDHGGRSQLLEIPNKLRRLAGVNISSTDKTDEESRSPGVSQGVNESAKADPHQGRFQPQLIPAPGADGVIRLDSRRPYRAAEIEEAGSLVLVGTNQRPAKIIIDDMPLRISADQLTLENIQFRCTDASARAGMLQGRRPAALLQINSQNLTLRGCRFRTAADQGRMGAPDPARQPGSRSQRLAAIDWNVIEPNDPNGGRAVVVNTVFSGVDSAVRLSTMPRAIHVTNCLKLGSGALLDLAATGAGSGIQIKLQQVTLRRADALMRLRLGSEGSPTTEITFNAVDCVLDLERRGGALFQFIAKESPTPWLSEIVMSGEGTLVSPGLVVASWWNPSNRSETILVDLDEPDQPALQVEGLFASRFRFAGDFSLRPQDSMVSSHEAPSRGSDPPGIDATTLSPLGISVERPAGD